MPKAKFILRMLTHLLRIMGAIIAHWPVTLLAVCFLSPISPHLRIPYGLAYDDCSYIGAHGIIRKDELSCPTIALIDTRNHGGLWW